MHAPSRDAACPGELTGIPFLHGIRPQDAALDPASGPAIVPNESSFQSPSVALSEPPVAGATATLWWVLHTRPRQEKALAQDLSDRGLEHFLPLQQTVRYYGKRKFRVELPLFSGYLFLRGSLEQAIQADRTGRVASVIKVKDQVLLDKELAAIRLALDRGAVLTVSGTIEAGDHVEVTAGPFKGLRGIVERLGTHDRLLLGVHLINRAAVLEIDHGLLQRAD